MQARLADLRQVFGGVSAAANPDRDLRNQYGVIVIDKSRHAGVNTALALRFATGALEADTAADRRLRPRRRQDTHLLSGLGRVQGDKPGARRDWRRVAHSRWTSFGRPKLATLSGVSTSA
jgi:hypothetical protein